MEYYKWKRDLIDRLIVLFKRNEHLYNASHENYNDKNERAATIRYIGMELRKLDPKVTFEAVRRKMQILRTQYSRERRSIMESRRAGKKYVPKLWCFNKLNFLKRHCSLKVDDTKTIPHKKEFIIPTILQNLKEEVKQSISNGTKRKYQWLGQLVVTEINKIEDEDIQEALAWEIQQILHDARIRSIQKTLNKSPQLGTYSE